MHEVRVARTTVPPPPASLPLKRGVDGLETIDEMVGDGGTWTHGISLQIVG